MTLKQLLKELDRSKKDLAAATHHKEELVKENAPEHVIAGQEKWIAYYEKQVKKYNDMYPEVKLAEEEKILKKIAKEQIKAKASTIGYIVNGNDLRGVTPDGKRWYAEHNHYGWTDRTVHCYSLRIDGNVIFSSGTLERVLETVAQH